tara:strand:- start:2034 stop:2408 length:375 start_codon:yes stop_codon:yes gene_type:complete
MPNTPPIELDQRVVRTAPTDVKAQQADVLNYTQFLTQILEQHYIQQYPDSTNKLTFTVETGRRYLKIIQDNSVHAFVDKTTGDVYKPASWKSPAKIVRYNLLDEQSRIKCYQCADWSGGYLYLR